MYDISIEVLDGVIFGWIEKSDHSEETLKLKVEIGGEFNGFVTAMRMNPDYPERFDLKYEVKKFHTSQFSDNSYSVDDIKLSPVDGDMNDVADAPADIFAEIFSTKETQGENLLDEKMILNENSSDEDNVGAPPLGTDSGLDDAFSAPAVDSLNGSIVGFVETFYPKRIVGWARDLAAPQDSLTIRVYLGDLLVAEGLADKARTDILDEDGQVSYCGFEIAIDSSESKTDVFAVKAGDANVTISRAESPEFQVLEQGPILLGSVDLLENNMIVGWAYRPTDPDQPVELEILIDDKPVGSVAADIFRDDLLDAGIGNGKHAFAFTFPLGCFDGKPAEIIVRSAETGIILPMATGLSASITHDNRFTGAADSIATDLISGWIINHMDPHSPVDLAIYLDQALIGRGKTGQYRKDIARNFRGHGFYGFTIRFNRKITQEDFASLRLVTIPQDFKVRILPGLATRLPQLPVAKTANLKGYLDAASRSQIFGWAVNEGDASRPLTVNVFVNDVLIRSATAGNVRQDLIKPYPDSSGRVGFSYQLPFGISLGNGAAKLSVAFADNNEDLGKSPMSIAIGRPGVYLLSPSVKKFKHELRRSKVVRPQSHSVDGKVAAIVLNRDGADMLEDMFGSIDLHNSYKSLEFIIIDHGSVDRSSEVCRKWSDNFSIRFVDRKKNYSYSASNNYAVSLTDAEYLFFLNNDIQFDGDLITRGIGCLSDEVGIVGYKLVTPSDQTRLRSGVNRADMVNLGFSFEQVQHLGVRMTTSIDDRPFLPFEEPLNSDNDSFSTTPMEMPAVTAAVLMVTRDDFVSVGGFHEEYFYGFEDVDFCLTFSELTGKKIISLNDMKAYHFRSASIDKASHADKLAKSRNREILQRRLGTHILRRLKTERINNAPFLRDAVVRVAFAVSEVSDTTPAGDYFTALEIARSMSARHNFECVFLDSKSWYDLKDFDVVIAMVDGFRPSLIQSARTDLVLIVWVRNWFDRWINAPEMGEFDAIWVSSQKAHDAFSAKFGRPVELVRIATDLDRFEAGQFTSAYKCDYCFTGSHFGSWRDIIGCFAPDELPYDFGLFGHGWDEVEWLKPYWRGGMPYSAMPDIYASTRIVLDDANHTTLLWGGVNSRVFDAIAAGALVMTNSRAASDDAFDGLLPVYTSRESLKALLERYLDDEVARLELVAKLQEIVSTRHRYTQRADTAYSAIQRLFAQDRVTLSLSNSKSHVDGLAQLCSKVIWQSGGIAHLLPPKPSVFARIRDKTASIQIRFSDLTGAGNVLNDLAPYRTNILVLASEQSEISSSLMHKLIKAFDIFILPDETDVDALRAMGCEHLLTLTKGKGAFEGRSEVEKRHKLHTLFQSSFERTFNSINDIVESIVENKSKVAPATSPSLTYTADPEGIAGSTIKTLCIGYVLWDYPALSQTFVLNEIRWLVHSGYDVKVYFKSAPDRAGVLDFEVDSYKVADADDLAELLQAHNRNVMHCPFAYPAATHLTYPAAKATGIPFTIMPAGVDISHYDNMQRNRIAEISGSPLCLGVITIGTYHYQFLVEQGVPNEKIILERQAVDLPNVTIDRSTVQRDGSRPKVISIGRFVEKKGMRYLVEAAANLPEFDIILYGYGPLDAELRALADRLEVSNVTFGGSLDDTKALWQAYAEADIFVLACVRATDGDLDGLPTVLVEAMAAGVPVVSTRIANVPDLVIDGITGKLCNPKDALDLSDAIRNLYNLPKERINRITAAARDHARNYASVERTMATLVRTWQERTIDIVLVTYCRGKHGGWVETSQVIDRLLKYTVTPFNIFVVDNGSEESFLNNFRATYGGLKNVHLLAMNKNLWCGPASNIGFRTGNSEYMFYVCSNEGYALRRGWDLEMIKYMEARPNTGMAGRLVTMPAYYNGETYKSYPLFDRFRNQDFAEKNPERKLAHVQGGVFILRRTAFDAIGGFNDATPHDGMDVEFSYCLESAGWDIGSIPHVYGATTKTIPNVNASADERTLIIHPLSPAVIDHFDRIANGAVKSCNICNWEGSAFKYNIESQISVCPSCQSTNFSRTIYKLLALDGTLQKKPSILALMQDPSLETNLRRLSTSLTYHVGGDEVIDWQQMEQPDLLIVDHRIWTEEASEPFLAFVEKCLIEGAAVIIGSAIEGVDPIAVLEANSVPLTPVVYDSMVRDFDWRPIVALNIEVNT